MSDAPASLGLAWKVLYDEDFEEMRNPNDPANASHFKKKREQIIAQYKRLMTGPTKVLFDRWRDDVRKMNIMLVTDSRNTECNCSAGVLLREINLRFKLMLEVEQIIKETEGEQK